MGFLKLFSGPSPEKLEQNGDDFFHAGHWGKAKLEYEHALEKLHKKTEQEKGQTKRLEGKLLQSREALAMEHHKNASDLIEADCLEEARELLVLAMEITDNSSLKEKLEEKIEIILGRQIQNREAEQSDFLYGLDRDEGGDENRDEGLDEDAVRPYLPSEDDTFLTLCSTLPEDVRNAYHGYGEAFKKGYVALNQGDFRTAEAYLFQAIKENDRSESYIPLELATVYANTGKLSEAKELLETFLIHHPEALPAYELLCEIYWEEKDFDKADSLLASVPEEYADSTAFFTLKGESFYQAGRYTEARDHYRRFLDTFGWGDTIARQLARVYEALNDEENARDIYKQLLAKCKSCHTCQTQIDPTIKHKYAELSFSAGMYGTDILELYLSLSREIPHNAAHYYHRISQIYNAQGNATEAKRFEAFSEEAQKKIGIPTL